MADPYATRAPDLSGRPLGPAPWRDLVGELGGTFVDERAGFEPGATFVVIDCRGVGTLAPFARVPAALGALLWIEHTPATRSAHAANALRASLVAFDGLVVAIKQGCVGGPRDREGCTVIDADLIAAVLERALAGEVGWETDPDFGYDVPALVPGLGEEAARALLPRLLYADHDRVYEHAELVTRKKRERFEIARSLPWLDRAIGAASGWPPAPTSWREA